MNNFKKGDILIGEDRSFKSAYHPIIYIDGSKNTPLAVILTRSNDFSCNIKLSGNYDVKASYFVAHLIEKMSEWGPYEKIDELVAKDINLIQIHISNQTYITYEQYEKYTKGECPDHA